MVHKYPGKGHTFLPCKRDFAIVEKRKKVCKSLTLKDLVEVVVTAAQKKHFTCIFNENFHDFKAVAYTLIDTKKLGILKASQFRVTIEDFGKVQVAKGTSEIAGWSTRTNVLKQGVTLESFKNLTLPTARNRFGIPQKKK
ncbi:hypothetical protein J6590_104534, partial [Homalodisca vitripennis]